MMDLNENGSLAVLEHLLEEFFSPLTNNSRKHEIELQLNSLKTSPNFGKLCLFFLTNTASQYVTMFALSTLETVINQQWARTDWSYREELKNVLHNYLIEKGNSSPHFIRGKYAKLLVDIAKFDWPDRYPHFMINIIELLKSEPNQQMGLILLRTMSEEFMGLHAVFENGRRADMTRLLQPYIPVFFELLTNILENLGSRPRHLATATPPPSPTQAPPLASSPQPLTTRIRTAGDPRVLTRELLHTVQHLLTWAPIRQVPPRIIKAIFHFTNVATYAQEDDDMCVLAMSTINELLYRKCSPPDSQEFFTHLYHHTVELLKDLVHSSSYRVDTIDIGFVEKLSELLVLLMEQHMWRLETDPSFSAMDFLSPLFQLTMQLPSVQCYLRCLAVWAAFIKQIKPENAHKYSEALIGLVTALLQKMQFLYNSDQLKEVNNTDFNDDNETEWLIYVKSTIEVLAMIAKYAPTETFNRVLVPWKTAHDMYQQIENAVDHQNGSLNLHSYEIERVYFILRDYNTLTQCLARLSSLSTDQANNDSSALNYLIGSLIEKLLESALLATRVRFYNLKIGDSKLKDCFIDVHSEILGSLKTWLPWMSANGKLSHQTVKLLLEASVPFLLAGTDSSGLSTAPTRVSHAGAYLLLGYSTVVPPPLLLVHGLFTQFVQCAPGLMFPRTEMKQVALCGACAVLLRPWSASSEEEQTRRSAMFTGLMDLLCADFLQTLTPDSSENRAREVSGALLPVLSHLLQHCRNYTVASKKLFYFSIKSTIDHALYLFPSYVKFPEVSDHILVFFLNILEVLQQQLGLESTKRTIQTFLQIAVSEQQASFVSIDKLLQIFQLVVESPGATYKNFLPGILQFCMENIYPVVVSQTVDHPDVFLSLLSLLYSILLHRWQYFYTSQVKLGYSPGCSETGTGPDSPQKPEQLLAVLQVFGQALLQQDINIFRLSLASLEDLNSKWKLYHKTLFRNHLLSKFLSVLLQTLIEKSQDLLSEEIQVAIFNMASVNFHEFFTAFLRQFITSSDEANPHWEVLLHNFMQNHDKDMPTFVQHLQRFVSGVQQMRMCNLSQIVS